MLYSPPAFKEDDPVILAEFMERHPFATLITVVDGEPCISHVPLLLKRQMGSHGILFGHLARGNPQFSLSMNECIATAIFHGAQAYVRPGWYPSKAEHGKVVPTWNYTVVHARGRLRFFEMAEHVHKVVDDLTASHEQPFPRPWASHDAPDAYIAAQLKGIVGFELVLQSVEGKFKLSQNRNEADYTGVINGMDTSTNPEMQAVAALMKTRASNA
jgi:transcriptional regulator